MSETSASRSSLSVCCTRRSSFLLKFCTHFFEQSGAICSINDNPVRTVLHRAAEYLNLNAAKERRPSMEQVVRKESISCKTFQEPTFLRPGATGRCRSTT